MEKDIDEEAYKGLLLATAFINSVDIEEDKNEDE